MDVTEPLGIRIQSVVIDAHDPIALVRFWSAALGWRITEEDPEESVLEPPEGSPPTTCRPTCCSAACPRPRRSRTASTWTYGPTIRTPTSSDSSTWAPRGPTWARTAGELGRARGSEGNEFCVLSPLKPTAA